MTTFESETKSEGVEIKSEGGLLGQTNTNHKNIDKYIKRINVEHVIHLKQPKYLFNYEQEDKFIEKFYVSILNI